jgi:hypothetical protein
MHIKESKKLSKLFFHTGFFLISILTVTLLISSLFFFFHGTMGAWQFPLGILGASVLNYFLFVKNREEPHPKLYVIFGLPLLLTILSIGISGYFYDTSFDGQAYHMEALIQMKNGWNPFWQYLPDNVNQAIWVNHYAKGMETIQAAIYCTFGNIEMGKATNIMLWLGSFFITLSFIVRNEWVSLTKGIIISGLLASNPIVLNQLLCYYVDGALGSLLLCLLATGMLLLQKSEVKYYLLIAAIIILSVNVKFTALLYLTLFISGFLIWSFVSKQITVCKKIWWTSVIAGFIAISTGFNPYITNTVHFGNPLYPLMGGNKVDIINELNLPAGFENKSGLERFVISTFARTDNIYPKTPYPVEIKVPFTFNRTDIVHASMVDARLGGFGPLYSGILLLWIALVAILSLKVRRHLVFRNLIWFSSFIIISIIIMPESWWARYIPQFWLLPVVWLLAAEILLVNQNLIVKRAMYIALVVNLFLCMPGFLFNVILTSKINYQLALLKSSSQTVIVDWGASASNRSRFARNNIPYKISNLKGLVAGKEKEYMAGAQTWFVWPVDVDKHIEKPWLLKYMEPSLPFMWGYYGR